MSMSEGDPLGVPEKPARPAAPDTSGYGAGPIPPGATQRREDFDLGRHRLAGWGQRAGAWLIDLLIILAIAAVIAVPLLAAVPALSGSTSGWIGIVLIWLLGLLFVVVAWTLYAPLLMKRWNGQTVGKRAVGIRVIKADGEPMDLGTAFIRETLVKGVLIAAIAIFTFFLLPLVDYLWPLWDDENRALHDYLCSTRVVAA